MCKCIKEKEQIEILSTSLRQFLVPMKYLSLFRIPNLIIIVLTQCLTYLYLNALALGGNQNFTPMAFCYLTLSTVFAAMAGNIINDILDIQIDKINVPQKAGLILNIGVKKLQTLYFGAIGVTLLFAILFDLQHGGWWLVFYQIIISALLFIYSKYLKKLPLIGNLLVALLCGLVVAIVIFAFDIFMPTQSVDNQFIWLYVLFAILTNLFREIIKDIEDIEGDRANSCHTLPIVLGIRGAKIIAVIILFVVSIATFLLYAIPQLSILVSIIIVLTFAIIFQTIKADSTAAFHRISQVTKLLMLLGLGLLVLH